MLSGSVDSSAGDTDVLHRAAVVQTIDTNHPTAATATHSVGDVGGLQAAGHQLGHASRTVLNIYYLKQRFSKNKTLETCFRSYSSTIVQLEAPQRWSAICCV